MSKRHSRGQSAPTQPTSTQPPDLELDARPLTIEAARARWVAYRQSKATSRDERVRRHVNLLIQEAIATGQRIARVPYNDTCELNVIRDHAHSLGYVTDDWDQFDEILTIGQVAILGWAEGVPLDGGGEL